MKYAKLTNKIQGFINEYLRDFNGKQAAIRAGYSPRTAEFQASRLLSKAKVKEAVDKAKARAAAEAHVTMADVLKRLKLIGFHDIGTLYDKDGSLKPIHEMTEEARAAIAAIEVEAEGGTVVRKIRTKDSIRALELIGKHLGGFKERIEVAQITTLEAADRLLAQDEGADK